VNLDAVKQQLWGLDLEGPVEAGADVTDAEVCELEGGAGWPCVWSVPLRHSSLKCCRNVCAETEHARTHTRTYAHTHAHKHTHTHAHTHTTCPPHQGTRLGRVTSCTSTPEGRHFALAYVKCKSRGKQVDVEGECCPCSCCCPTPS